MAQKVKKKYIETAAVDASKILFDNNQVLQAKKADLSGNIDIFKVNAQNKIEFLDGILSIAGSDANSVVVKSQMESAISAERVVRLAAEAILQGNIDAEALLRASEDVRILGVANSYADSQDIINLAAAKSYCDSQDVINLASAKAYADQKDAVTLASAKSYADAQDAITLASANAYTDSEKTRAMAAEGVLTTNLNSEISRAGAAELALSNRVSPLENRAMYNSGIALNDNAAVYTNGQPGIEDPSASQREGWYFKNSVANQGIGWYFFDKTATQSNIAKSDFSAYVVMTFDAVGANGAKPILAFYSYPTGSGDAYAGFYHSKWTYQLSQTNLNGLVAGKKYLLYAGSDPAIHPELTHVSMDFIAASSAGPQLSTEIVGFSSFIGDAATSVNKMQWMVESLGASSTSFKNEIKLKIRYAQKANLDSEISRATAAEGVLTTNLNSEISARTSAVSAEQTARIAGDNTLTTNLNSEISRAQSAEASLRTDLNSEISNRSAAVTAEATARSNADSSIRTDFAAADVSTLNSAKSYADGIMVTEQNARSGADSALSARLVALEADPTTKTYVDSKVSDEKSARQLADQGLNDRIAILEQDPTTKSYVDGQDLIEKNARIAADLALGGRLSILEQDPTTKAYVDQKITDLINGAPGALDTLKELADQLASDENAVVALTNSVAANLQTAKDYADAQANAEKVRAMGIESGHESRIHALEQDPTTKTYVDGKFSDASATAHSELEAAIAQEVLDRNAAILVESNNRVSEDNVIKGRLDSLELDEVKKAYVDSQDMALSTKLSGDLTSAISKEVSDRNDAISVEAAARDQAISAEAMLRSSADSALDVRVSSLEFDVVKKTYVDSSILGEHNERVSSESVINGRLDALELDEVKKQYVDEQISQTKVYAESYTNGVVLLEKGRAEGIEQGLRLDLDAEIARAEAAEAQALVDAKAYSDIEKASRISDVNGLDIRLSILEEDPTTQSYVDGQMSTERTARIAGDHALDMRVGVLEQDPTTKAYVDSRISSLSMSGGSAVQAVADGLAQEILDRQGAVSQEISDRQAGDVKALSDAKAYADQQISALVNSAPGMLDTLKEIADAIGDDPNFAATVASQVNAVHNEVAALKGMVVFHKENFTLSASDISNGYVDMSFLAADQSMNAFTDGLAVHEGFDYNLSMMNGVTRFSFVSGADFAAGDKMYVQYFSKLV